MRLHKFIANCGYTSRRRAELLIQAGRVSVNRKVRTSLGTTVKPDDVIAVNGEALELPEPRTILLNKPEGIITSTHDTHERLTVMDILPRSLRDAGVLPVGRLDQDTRGLLLLTNVGDLNHRITHPSFETEKEYEALVRGRPSRKSLDRLEQGVTIEGRRTAPARITHVESAGRETIVRIVLHEGKKRQVRRMFSTVGHEVLELTRLRIGKLLLGDVPAGEWRELDNSDLDRLGINYEAVLTRYRKLQTSGDR